MNVLCAVTLKHLKGGFNEPNQLFLVLFSLATKTEILSVNKRAKDTQFENILNVQYAYHFLLSSHKSMFIKVLYAVLFGNAKKKKTQ